MKEDLRGKVVELRGRIIPRNEKGDPAFTQLGIDPDELSAEALAQLPDDALLKQFTPEEITAMVNRYLYQQEYQRTVHRQRARQEADTLRPLKYQVRKMFGCGYLDATAEQIREAATALKLE